MSGEWLGIAAAGGIGFAVGAAFFGGLWLTVRSAATAKNLAARFFFSWMLRMALLLAAFFFVVQTWRWQGALACMAGVLLARFFIIRAVKRSLPGPPKPPPDSPGDGA